MNRNKVQQELYSVYPAISGHHENVQEAVCDPCIKKRSQSLWLKVHFASNYRCVVLSLGRSHLRFRASPASATVNFGAGVLPIIDHPRARTPDVFYRIIGAGFGTCLDNEQLGLCSSLVHLRTITRDVSKTFSRLFRVVFPYSS